MDSFWKENQAEETWNFLDGTTIGTLKSEESKGLSEDTLYLRARVQNNLKEFNKTIKGLQDCLKGQEQNEQEPSRKQERIIRVEHILQERKDKKLLAKELIGEHIRRTTGGTSSTDKTHEKVNSNSSTHLRDRGNTNISEIPCEKYASTGIESKDNQQLEERENQTDQRRSYPGFQTTTLNLSGSVIEDDNIVMNIDSNMPDHVRDQKQQQNEEAYAMQQQWEEQQMHQQYQQEQQEQEDKLTDDNVMQEKLKELIQLEELNDKGRFTFCPSSTKEHPHPHWVASRYIAGGQKRSRDFNSFQSSENQYGEEEESSGKEGGEEVEQGQIAEENSRIKDSSKEEEEEQQGGSVILIKTEKKQQANLNEIKVIPGENKRIVKEIKDSVKKQTNSRAISNGCLMDELAALKKSEKIILSSNRITSLKQSAQLRQSKVFASNSHDTLILNRTQITPQQRDISSSKQKGRKNTIDVFALLHTFKQSEKETKNTILSEGQQSKSNKQTSNIQMAQSKLNSTVNKVIVSNIPAAETTIYQRSLSKSKSSSNVVTWNKTTSKTPKNKFILVDSSSLADKSDFTQKYSSFNNSNSGTTRKSNTPNVSAAKHNSIIQSNSHSSNHSHNLNNQSCSGYQSSNNRQSSNASSFLISNYASENPNEQRKTSSISIHEQQSTAHKNHFALDLSNISSSTSAHLSNNNSSNQYLSVKDNNTSSSNKGMANPSSRPPQCVSSNKQTKYFETQLQTHYISPNVFSDSIISAQNNSNPLDCSKLQQQPLANQRDLNSASGSNNFQANNLQQSGQQVQKNMSKKCSSNSSSAQKNSSKGSVRSHMSNEQKNNNIIENRNFFEKTSPIIQQIKNERENAPPVSYVYEFQKKKQLQRQNSYNNSASYLQIQQLLGK